AGLGAAPCRRVAPKIHPVASSHSPAHRRKRRGHRATRAISLLPVRPRSPQSVAGGLGKTVSGLRRAADGTRREAELVASDMAHDAPAVDDEVSEDASPGEPRRFPVGIEPEGEVEITAALDGL